MTQTTSSSCVPRPANPNDFHPGKHVRIEAHIKKHHPNTLQFHRVLTNPNLCNITAGGRIPTRGATEATLHLFDVGVRTLTISNIKTIQHTPGVENYPDQFILTATITHVEPWDTVDTN